MKQKQASTIYFLFVNKLEKQYFKFAFGCHVTKAVTTDAIGTHFLAVQCSVNV